MAILSKACKPDNFELHNSLKLSFTNIQGLRSNLVDCGSLLESNSPVILALCETKPGWLNWFWQFLCQKLTWKDSSTHMHGLAVYVKEGLPFAGSFRLALLHSVSYFFFLYWSPSSALCMVFDSISSNIDEVLSINPSANVFVFGDFNIHHKDWLTYSGGTDRPDELSFIFSILHDLSYLDSRLILIVLHFLISYFLLMLVFVLQWLSLHEEIMFLSQFPLTFHQIHNGIPHFIT